MQNIIQRPNKRLRQSQFPKYAPKKRLLFILIMPLLLFLLGFVTVYHANANRALKVGINGAACAYDNIVGAIDAANDGDTIFVSGGSGVNSITYNEQLGEIDKSLTIVAATSDCSAESPLALSTSVIIDGGGGNADGLGGLLEVGFNRSLTLRHITLQNATSNYGGLVYVGSSAVLTLDDSDVRNGTASIAGGGVHVRGTLRMINGSSAYSNMTTGDGDGGGVSAQLFGRIELLDGTIKGNSSADNGGGVFLTDGGTLTASGSSTIHDNEAISGGGIYAGSGINSIVLSDTVKIGYQISTLNFGNTVVDSGGGIYLDDSDLLTVRGQARVSANSAKFGGGIYAASSSVMFDDDGLLGGADAGNGNQSLSHGAGAFLTGKTTMTLHDASAIANNTAQGAGGGVYALDSTVQLQNFTTVSTNKSDSTGGGGLYLNVGSRLIAGDQVTLQSNQANFGGAIAVYESSQVTLSATVQISNNVATSSGGGAIRAGSGATIAVGGSTQIISNTAATNGGGISATGDGTTIIISETAKIGMATGTDDMGNSAVELGGGVYLADSADLTLLDNAQISANNAQSGGGIYALGNGTTISLTDQALIGGNLPREGNTAVSDDLNYKRGGGVFLTTHAQLTLNGDSAIAFNDAEIGGGGVSSGFSGRLVMNDSSQVRYNGSRGGGGLSISGSALIMRDNATLLGNHATFGGGGMFVSTAATVEMYDQAQLVENEAGTTGGGIYVLGSTLDLTGNVLFSDNVALQRGGAMYLFDTSLNASSDGATSISFLRNEAVDGGAFFLSGAGNSMTLENVTIADNSASRDGGGLYIDGGTAVISGAFSTTRAASCDPAMRAANRYCSEFYNNSAADGAAIYALGSDLTLQQTSVFSNATTSGTGSAVVLDDGGQALLDTVLVAQNANITAAIDVRDNGPQHSLTVLFATVADNAATPLRAEAGSNIFVGESIIWDNAAGTEISTGAFFDTRCNDAQSAEPASRPFDGATDISIDPQFIATMRGSYFLPPDSTVIDLCSDATPIPDIEGVMRPYDGDGFASANDFDMGAFEYDGYTVPTAVDLREMGIVAEIRPIFILSLLLTVLTIAIQLQARDAAARN